MIRIDDLVFAYRRSNFRLAVDTLQVESCQRIAFTGPSGSGKTTLLNLIAGIVSADQGSIRVDDFVVSDLSETARRDFRIKNFGLVFQRFELVEYLSALDNVLLPFRINRQLTLDSSSTRHAKALLEQTGLADKLHRKPGQLSQGEQQRVAICRALVTQPRWILADEPTGNLDPSNKRQTIELLFDFCRENSAGLITVTHDTGILDGFDRVVNFSALLASQPVPTVGAAD